MIIQFIIVMIGGLCVALWTGLLITIAAVHDDIFRIDTVNFWIVIVTVYFYQSTVIITV